MSDIERFSPEINLHLDKPLRVIADPNKLPIGSLTAEQAIRLEIIFPTKDSSFAPKSNNVVTRNGNFLKTAIRAAKRKNYPLFIYTDPGDMIN